MLATALVVLASLRSLREHQAVTIAAVGAATVVAIGVVVANPAAPPVKSAFVPATGHSIAAAVAVDSHTTVTQSAPVTALSTNVELTHAGRVIASKPAHKPARDKALTDENDTETDEDEGTTGNHGCGGKPTNAPPSVPVGPRPNHETGSPVTHPGPGGCHLAA